MFLCRECLTQAGDGDLADIFLASYGRCEGCGTSTVCCDVPRDTSSSDGTVDDTDSASTSKGAP